MSADLRANAYHDAPRVTPEREASWREWVSNYAVSCAQTWIAAGDTSDDDVRQGMAAIFADFDRLDGMEWMSLGHAFSTNAEIAMAAPDQPATGDLRTAYMLALRTIKTASEYETALALSYQMGLSIQQSQSLLKRAKAAEAGPNGKDVCSLYRHFDAQGRLLYVGIAKSPELRAEQHQRSSRWCRFVADSTVEWLPSRAAACEAERVAIMTEKPIFNETHNKANRDAALEYMFEALSGRAAGAA